MATFVALISETQQGGTNIGKSVARAKAFREAASKLGITVKDTYWTMGQYDGVLIFDAPDDETAAAAVCQLNAQGAVRTTTMRSFSAEEMDAIVKRGQ